MKCVRLLAMQKFSDGRPRNSRNIQLFGALVETLHSSKRSGVSWRVIYFFESLPEMHAAHFGNAVLATVQLHCGVTNSIEDSTVAPYDIRDFIKSANINQVRRQAVDDGGNTQ